MFDRRHERSSGVKETRTRCDRKNRSPSNVGVVFFRTTSPPHRGPFLRQSPRTGHTIGHRRHAETNSFDAKLFSFPVPPISPSVLPRNPSGRGLADEKATAARSRPNRPPLPRGNASPFGRGGRVIDNNADCRRSSRRSTANSEKVTALRPGRRSLRGSSFPRDKVTVPGFNKRSIFVTERKRV